MEELAFRAQDALIVVDDFVSVDDVGDAALQRTAEQLFRSAGNGEGFNCAIPRQVRLAFRAAESVHGTVVHSVERVTKSMDANVYRAIQQLPRLTVAALKIKYREAFGEETKSAHKQFLVWRLAWHLQAETEGGLSERARRAVEIVDNPDLRIDAAQSATAARARSSHSERDPRLPLPGSVVRRSYQGREIAVRVLEQGFDYENEQYTSLSAVARQVTGTRWNGLLFFGLTERCDG